MDILLDTSIIVIYGRNREDAERIELKYNIFSGQNRLYISIVTLGEIDAFVKKMNLGERRRAKMQSLIDQLTIIGIHYDELIEAYGDIDAYSSGKIPIEVNQGRFSAKNMGKNDLWIAATAKAFNLNLITTDKDYLTLDKDLIDVVYIDHTSI